MFSGALALSDTLPATSQVQMTVSNEWSHAKLSRQL